MKGTSQGNCPNCGAPITGSICEYCNTRHALDLSILEGKTVRVSFEHSGCKQVFDLFVTDIGFTYHSDTYFDITGKERFSVMGRTSVAINGEVIPFRQKEVV